METRAVEFFTKKIELIDDKIEKSFDALKENSEGIRRYEMKDSETEVKSEYVGTYQLVANIESLERLRFFYLRKKEEAKQ